MAGREQKEQSNDYEDILYLPHPVSTKHPHMGVLERAAQFLPFAALTGYDDEIRETARLTTERPELDDGRKEALNAKLQILFEEQRNHPSVTITYFKADEKKQGGAYQSVSGELKKMDDFLGILLLMDGTKIEIHDMIEIESELF